jgi:hypothetical protein
MSHATSHMHSYLIVQVHSNNVLEVSLDAKKVGGKYSSCEDRWVLTIGPRVNKFWARETSKFDAAIAECCTVGATPFFRQESLFDKKDGCEGRIYHKASNLK